MVQDKSADPNEVYQTTLDFVESCGHVCDDCEVDWKTWESDPKMDLDEGDVEDMCTGFTKFREWWDDLLAKHGLNPSKKF